MKVLSSSAIKLFSLYKIYKIIVLYYFTSYNESNHKSYNYLIHYYFINQLLEYLNFHLYPK